MLYRPVPLAEPIAKAVTWLTMILRSLRNGLKRLKRRVKDSRDPVRYMLVSEFSRKFILYYDVSTDTFAMNNASRGTLFKRREIAESVKDHLGQGIALVKFTVKGGRLKRLSPLRGMRLRTRSARPIRRRTGHAHKTRG